MVRTFAQASTPVSPLRASHALVTGGPYRFTRNPDYIGQTAIFAGVAIARNRLWPLLLLPLVLAIVHRDVVEREERDLDRRFGEAYREYAGQVPRWL
jgi:protein-S-isoprenylcysteine O-methyltransferase Ste14